MCVGTWCVCGCALGKIFHFIETSFLKLITCAHVHCLLQMLDALLTTIIRQMQNQVVPGRQEEARLVARRFVRSVARVYVVLNVEMTPSTGKKRW